MTNHGHAADSTGTPQASNRGGRAGRTGIVFPSPPRDPRYRSRGAGHQLLPRSRTPSHRS